MRFQQSLELRASYIAQNAKHKTWRKDGQAYEFAQISETVISLLASSSDGSEIS